MLARIAALILVALGQADVERALAIARAPEGDRASFHARYLTVVKDSQVEQIEVISEFRRLVLTAEEHLRRGDWLFTQSPQSAIEAVRPWQGTASIVAQLRFHPLNAYVTAPSIEIRFDGRDGSPGPEALDSHSTTLYVQGPSRTSKTNTGIPISGEIVEARFEQSALARQTLAVVVLLDGRELARALIDFSRIE
jgi:hypothetical protein